MNPQRPSVDSRSEEPRAPWTRAALALGVVAVIVAGFAVALLLRGAGTPVDRPAAPVGGLVPVHQPGVLFRNADGVVVTVPKGLAQQRHPFELPPTIEMSVGQRIEVRNEDEIAHIVFGMVVPPGGARTMTLDEPGIQVYSAGCAAHVSGSGLTILKVSAPNGAP